MVHSCSSKMSVRGALFALVFIAVHVRAQKTSVWVDVQEDITTDSPMVEVERQQFTHELMEELLAVKADALLLYTDFTGRAGLDLRHFLKNITMYLDDARRSADQDLKKSSEECLKNFENQMKKIKHVAHRAATFSSENHHKFLLGPMIVFRMHINKSEEYIMKCDQAVKLCGTSCETAPRVRRWKRLALSEIQRVHKDIRNSRLSYVDLLTHARRRLNHLRRQMTVTTSNALQELKECNKSQTINFNSGET